MPNTIGYSFGDVVLVPFPFTDQTSSKRRPGVLFGPAGAVGEALISDWKAAGLLKASLIKPVVTTIERDLILRKLGSLQSADVETLRGALRQVFG